MKTVASLAVLALALLVCGCSQIGTVRIQGGYVMGAGADQRAFNAGIDFVLREPKTARDGKQVVTTP